MRVLGVPEKVENLLLFQEILLLQQPEDRNHNLSHVKTIIVVTHVRLRAVGGSTAQTMELVQKVPEQGQFVRLNVNEAHPHDEAVAFSC